MHKYFRIKIPYPFQWGTPIFSASHSFGMMGAVLVAAVEVSSFADSSPTPLPPAHTHRLTNTAHGKFGFRGKNLKASDMRKITQKKKGETVVSAFLPVCLHDMQYHNS